jgi:hypothetical protein
VNVCACAIRVHVTRAAVVSARARLDAEIALSGVVSRDLELFEFLHNVIVSVLLCSAQSYLHSGERKVARYRVDARAVSTSTATTI